MPELPDISVYVDCLRELAVGARLARIDLRSPFVLRTVQPPAAAFEGGTVADVRRLGKRVVLAFDAAGGAPGGPLFAVIHLMIAGRLHWKLPGGKPPPGTQAAWLFDRGQLVLTEAGTQRRASIHLVQGEAALAALDPGGLEPLACSAEALRERLGAANHTLKRALTDPHLLSGVGNAYSDEILHRARLSPLALTASLDAAAWQRLHAALQAVLREWTARLRAEAGAFPGKVTAFHPAMAVHGRHGQPCPDCGAPVQRIVYASNETNYCARCQTGGRVLADRALSRLLKASFPRTLDEA